MLLTQDSDAGASRLPIGSVHGGGNCIIAVEVAKADAIRTEGARPRYIDKMLVSGWVVCREQVEKITFESNGVILGVAKHGIFRPDVGAKYLDYYDSDHAGFTVVLVNVPLDNEVVPDINISVTSKGGRRYDGKFRLQIGGNPSAIASTPRQVVPPPLSLAAFIDIAEVDSDNGLLVRGWAVAPAEIVAIQISADNKKLGLAKMGLDRSDVAENYPLYPSARNSGFEFQTKLSPKVSSDLKSIQVEVITRNGEVRTISADLARVKTRGQVAAEMATSPFASDAKATGVASPVESSVRWSCDLAEITRRGSGYVSGWAVSPVGIRAISIHSDGRTVGSARLGLSRDDVGAAIPDIANSALSGYEIHFDLGQSIEDAVSCVLRIVDRNGEAVEATISFEVKDSLSGNLEFSTEKQQGTAEDFRMYLDSPTIRGPQAIEPITGAVTVAGWAIARHGLKSVDVYFGDVLVAQAHLGSRRPDIAAVFPDWPDSLMSGFGLFVPAGMIKNGRQKLGLVLTDKRGVTRTENIQIDVQKTAAGEGDRPLRRKLPVVETDLTLRILSGAGVAPNFHLVITVDDSVSTRELLAVTFNSLAVQTYSRWQLFVVVPGAMDKKALKAMRSEIPAEIADKVEVRQKPAGHFAENFKAFENEEQVVDFSRYVVNLHAGDELAVDALLQVAMSNVGVARADFIYGDERRESPESQRVKPFLKPEWSPELLQSTNYIGRFWFATASLVDACFASIAEFVQTSDYDRVLKLTERAQNIRRVAKVLSERHSDQFENKKLEIQALQQAAKRRGIQATVEKGLVTGTYRFQRKLVKPGKVSIIIPSIAARGLVKTCIESIRSKSSFKNYEIVLIDNIKDASSEWKPWFQDNADKVLEILEDFNWSLFNNLGAYHTTGEYLLFLNDDIEVLEPQWLETLLEIAQQENVGVVGPYLLYPDRSVQHAGLFLSGPGTARHAFRFAPEDEPGYFGLALTQRDMIGVTGACMMVRREVFDALGGFNQAHSVINNDLDFCLRCNDVGLSVIYTPYARLIHHELASREKLPDTYDRESFALEWADRFSKGDPFFHPGLSRSDDYYSIDTEALREVYAGFPIAHKSQIRRIVAFKLDHIGDFITALPAIRRLKESFQEATLVVVVGPAVASLARSEAAIDEVLDFAFFHDRSGRGQKEVTEEDLLALKARLEPYQFDLAVDLRKHPDTRHVLQYSGARLFAGFDQANKFPWLDFGLEWEGDPIWVNKRQHVAGDLLNLIAAIANGCEEDRYAIHRRDVGRNVELPPAIAKIAKALYGRPVIGVHPASGNQLRQWPAEHFSALIDLLVTRLPVHIAIVGGPDEMELANAVIDKVKHRESVWSLVGAHKLSELPDVLSTFALFVGNNSGPKHVAAGLGVPTVAVHSAVVSTEEWGPIGPNAVALRKDVNCGPCYRAALEDCHRDIACLRAILPEDVYKLCLRFLTLTDPFLPLEKLRQGR